VTAGMRSEMLEEPQSSAGGAGGGEASYDALAERLLATGILTDPWVEGHPRFRQEPVVLTPAERDALYAAAEQVAMVHDEACRMCDADASLLDDFFALTPYQKLMWGSSRPLWHGIARADVFMTADGPAVCELNSDTPTGQPEAVLLGQIGREALPGAIDPCEGLGERMLALIAAFADSALGLDPPLSVGLVYPTELTEDLSLVRLYKGWLEEAGWSVTLGSPFNLSRGEEGELLLFDTPVQAVLRHYKTDWWGEREPPWDDAEPFQDPLPLERPLHVLLSAMLEQHCVVINPFGSVLSQNKRVMALMWEHLDRFSARARQAIRRYVPETFRLESAPRAELLANREGWVLKSDYGAEGDEVIVGKLTTPEIWAASLEHAIPRRWVAQRYFAALEGPGGETVNHGVFLIGGEAVGLYARVQAGATDVYATSAPALVMPPPGNTTGSP
jgi:glutathionylspermidine synthase